MSFLDRHPFLYSCSVCGAEVKVTTRGEGTEPEKKFSCEHTDATIWANRSVTLYGKGDVGFITQQTRRFRLTLKRFMELATGRAF